MVVVAVPSVLPARLQASDRFGQVPVLPVSLCPVVQTNHEADLVLKIDHCHLGIGDRQGLHRFEQVGSLLWSVEPPAYGFSSLACRELNQLALALCVCTEGENHLLALPAVSRIVCPINNDIVLQDVEPGMMSPQARSLPDHRPPDVITDAAGTWAGKVCAVAPANKDSRLFLPPAFGFELGCSFRSFGFLSAASALRCSAAALRRSWYSRSASACLVFQVSTNGFTSSARSSLSIVRSTREQLSALPSPQCTSPPDRCSFRPPGLPCGFLQTSRQRWRCRSRRQQRQEPIEIAEGGFCSGHQPWPLNEAGSIKTCVSTSPKGGIRLLVISSSQVDWSRVRQLALRWPTPFLQAEGALPQGLLAQLLAKSPEQTLASLNAQVAQKLYRRAKTQSETRACSRSPAFACSGKAPCTAEPWLSAPQGFGCPWFEALARMLAVWPYQTPAGLNTCRVIPPIRPSGGDGRGLR